MRLLTRRGLRRDCKHFTLGPSVANEVSLLTTQKYRQSSPYSHALQHPNLLLDPFGLVVLKNSIQCLRAGRGFR